MGLVVDGREGKAGPLRACGRLLGVPPAADLERVLQFVLAQHRSAPLTLLGRPVGAQAVGGVAQAGVLPQPWSLIFAHLE